MGIRPGVTPLLAYRSESPQGPYERITASLSPGLGSSPGGPVTATGTWGS